MQTETNEISDRNESEGYIVTVRVRLTEIGDSLAVIEPINAELGQSMAIAYEDVVDFGKLKASNEYFCTDEETKAA